MCGKTIEGQVYREVDTLRVILGAGDHMPSHADVSPSSLRQTSSSIHAIYVNSMLSKTGSWHNQNTTLFNLLAFLQDYSMGVSFPSY